MSDQKFRRIREIAEVKASVFLYFFPFIFLFSQVPVWAHGEKRPWNLKAHPITVCAPESMVALAVTYLPCVSSSSLGLLELCCIGNMDLSAIAPAREAGINAGAVSLGWASGSCSRTLLGPQWANLKLGLVTVTAKQTCSHLLFSRRRMEEEKLCVLWPLLVSKKYDKAVP